MQDDSFNFNIHHCRRDIGASGRRSAIKTVQENLMGEKYAELRQELAKAEKSFEKAAMKYPPSDDYAMPHDYWNGTWDDQEGDQETQQTVKEAILECKEHIEKALRRTQKHLDNEEFSEQQTALYNVLRIIEKK